MKLSKRGAEKFLKNGLKIVLPRLPVPVSKPKFKKTVKRKAKKRGRPSTRSNHSDKENQLPQITNSLTQPKLSLIKIDKVNSNLLKNCPQQLKLSAKDRKWLQATLTNGKSLVYSKVDIVNIQSDEVKRQGTVSTSTYTHVSHSSSNAAGTSREENRVEIRTVTPTRKAKEGYVPRRNKEHTSAELESPPKQMSTKKRKLDELRNGDENDDDDEINQLTKISRPSFIDETSDHNHNELENIIKKYPNHDCNDTLDREIKNTQVVHIPNGFVHKNFVIRIKQYCQNKPTTEVEPEQSTSVVSNTTKRENFRRGAKKTRKSITVEKTIGINLRTRTRSKEKQCTKIVQSQYKETIEKSHTPKKPVAPTRMITRRRAAASQQNNDFFSLPNTNKLLFCVEESNTSLPNFPQPSCSTSELNIKNESFTTVLKNGADVSLKNNRKTANTKNEKPIIDEPSPSTSKSVLVTEPSDHDILKNYETLVNSKKTSKPKLLKEITLDPEEITTQLRKISTQAICEPQKTENRPRRGSRLRKPKTPDQLFSSDHNKNENHHPKRWTNRTPKPEPSTSGLKIKSGQIINPANQQTNGGDVSQRTRKRMKKSEAQVKTETYNQNKKTLEDGNRSTGSKAANSNSDSSEKTTVLRKSARTRKVNSNLHSIGDNKRHSLNVTFSTKTPETIPRQKKKNSKWNSNASPCIVLDKLNATDISTYAITPLREDRKPLPSKSSEDYGIDDVNTDDSTDDEDRPKKIVPQWAKSITDEPTVQFYVPRELITNWMRPPKVRFTAKSLFS